MKFINYLNESSDWSSVLNTLEKRCMPFLMEFNAPIYRGYKKGIQGKISRKVTRKDRKPRFIPEDVHNELDRLLYNLFGWYPRSNGVFTGSESVARGFTTNITKVYLFFPVGEYSYIWTEDYMKIYKIYDKLTNMWNEFDDRTEEYKKLKEKLAKIVSSVYKRGNLNKAVENNKYFEAIFKCESFYLVDSDILIDYGECFMEEY